MADQHDGRSEHTPTPWRRSPRCVESILTDEESPLVVAFVNINKEANAEFIVRACNAHDALVEALREIQTLAAYMQSDQTGRKLLEKIGGKCQSALKAAGEL